MEERWARDDGEVLDKVDERETTLDLADDWLSLSSLPLEVEFKGRSSAMSAVVAIVDALSLGISLVL